MRAIAASLIVLSLAACQAPAVQGSLAQCRGEADRLYAAAPDRAARVSQYLMDCMEKHGFVWKIDDAHCVDILGHDTSTAHGECYMRKPKAD